MIGRVAKSVLKNADDLVSPIADVAIHNTRRGISSVARGNGNAVTRAVNANSAQQSRAVKRGIEDVQKEMAQNAANAMPIQDVINRTTGVDVPRKANGRRDMKSAKESANVFNQSSNREIIEANTKAADIKLADIRDRQILADEMADGRELVQRQRKSIEQARQKASIIEQTKSVGYDTNEIRAIRNQNIEQKRQQQNQRDIALIRRKNDIMNDPNKILGADAGPFSEDFTNMRSHVLHENRSERARQIYENRQSGRNLGDYAPNEINAQNSAFNDITDKQFNRMDKKAARKEKKLGIDHSQYKPKPMSENKLSQEKQSELKDKIKQRLEDKNVDTSNIGAKNKTVEKVSLQDKVKGNNFVYNMAAMGVGGGLVLNMASNKGQQTNAQLYGQY